MTTLTWLSLRNVATVHLLAVDQLNTYDVLLSDDVVFTKGAYDAFVGRCRRQGKSVKAGRRRRAEAASPTSRGGCQVSTLHKDHRDVLIAPVVSEKSYGLLDENKYTFLVRPDANKTEIKIAVEKVFNVKVTWSTRSTVRARRRRTRFGIGQARRHQARDRQPRRGSPHRHLRRSGLLTGLR